MKVFFHFIFVIILGLTCGSYVHADTNDETENIDLHSNYPIENGAISLPNNSTELHLHVDSQNAQMIRFFYCTPELDSKGLLKEEFEPTNGSDLEILFNSTDGFAYRMIIEAISEDGTVNKKSFDVHKGIDIETSYILDNTNC